jgi:Tfp pilus assembly protein PilX
MRQKLDKRGTATVVALIYMVLLTTLAAGFGSLVVTSTQVSKNDQAAARAQAAAEAGLQVFKNYMTQVSVPGSTPSANVIDTIGTSLQTLAAAATDAGGHTFTVNWSTTTVNGGTHDSIIYFPYSSYIQLYPNATDGFSVTIMPTYTSGALSLLTVSIVGTNNINSPTIQRQINVDFNYTAGSAGSPTVWGGFASNGVYSLGGISFTGGGSIAVASGTPTTAGAISSALTSGASVTLGGSTTVAGKVFYAGNISQVAGLGNNTINGVNRSTYYSSIPYNANDNYSDPVSWLANNFQLYVPTPPPTFSTDAFNALLPANVYWTPSSGGTYTNIRIKAGSGTVAKPLNISGNGTLDLEGLVIIESPNVVNFGGGTNTFNCTFVMLTNTTGATTDSISFGGQTKFGPMAAAPAPPATDPLASVRSASDYAVLAPTASVSLTASTSSTNFVGSIIGYTVLLNGASNVAIQNGTVMALCPSATFNGNSVCTIGGSGSITFGRSAGYTGPTNGFSSSTGGSSSPGYCTLNMTGYAEGGTD